MTHLMKRPNSYTYINNLVDHLFEPFLNLQDTNDTLSFLERISNYPSYPPLNHYVLEDNTSILEIAAQGFSKNDISIDIDGDVLTITANKNEEDKKDKNTQRYYICKKLGKRAFTLSFVLSDKFDLNNIDVSLDLGILKIILPIKEEKKKEKKTLEIK